MVYFFSAILTASVLTAICWPLFSRKESVESAVLEETQWDLLQRKKDVVLANIQDLDFEYKCGKLSEVDYRQIRSEFTAEVGNVYADIDQIESTHDLDALIRTEVAARRTKSVATEFQTATCSKCGHTNTSEHKFCSECGTRLP